MCSNKNKVLLSFDIEEFDLPKEQGADISMEEAISVSKEGTDAILDILKNNSVKATFFVTTTFAVNAKESVRRIIDEGHEVASHGCDHTNPVHDDVFDSKRILDEMFNISIKGYRQPRMFPVDDSSLKEAGYEYNSYMHPAFIPGRYMHFDQPRIPFVRNGLMQIPASVSPWIRLPIFWLACHNYPFEFYKKLLVWTLKYDHQLVLYFHPWEFIDLNRKTYWKIPYIIKRNSGDMMKYRLDQLIKFLNSNDTEFITFTKFISK